MMKMEGEIWQPAEQKLMPQNPKEKELWEEIEGADKPIQTILKRMNRVLRKQFPEIDIQTAESCSGHVKENESVEYSATLPEFKDRKRERNPSLFFMIPIEKATEGKNAAVKKFLDDLFDQAIIETNNVLAKESIIKEEIRMDPTMIYLEGGDEQEILKISCRFFLMEKNKTFETLKNFWKNIEKGLSAADGMQIETAYKKEDFYARKPLRGLVVPE